MVSKNTICLWLNGGAAEAAQFYAETFADSTVGTVFRAPGDYPAGKEGDVLVVEFSVMGIACIGLDGGPGVQHNEAFVLPNGDRRPGRNRPLVERDCQQRRPRKRMRLVQG